MRRVPEARKACLQSCEHMQLILDNIKDAILSVDEDGRNRTFNPTGESVFEYDAGDIFGPSPLAAASSAPELAVRYANWPTLFLAYRR
jgi:PAS domain-containing protein